MNLVFLFILLIGLIIVLVLSAKLVEGAFVHIANKFRINEFILGFFILAIITSLPEISIALVSSNESPELSVGNLIGATIVILTLVIGLSAIKYKGIEFKGRFSEKEVLLGLFTLFLMVAVLYDSSLNVFESILLLTSYSVFIYYIYRKFSKKAPVSFFLVLDNTRPIKLFLTGLVGIVGIIISSSYIVSTAGDIASLLGISETLIGILMLAVGTNLPEITILLTSKQAEEQELAVGNFFGSACVNVAILGLLGITSRGFQIDGFLSIVSGGVILIFAIFLFLVFSWSGKKLSRTEGFLLIAVYLAFLITELLILSSEV